MRLSLGLLPLVAMLPTPRRSRSSYELKGVWQLVSGQYGDYSTPAIRRQIKVIAGSRFLTHEGEFTCCTHGDRFIQTWPAPDDGRQQERWGKGRWRRCDAESSGCSDAQDHAPLPSARAVGCVLATATHAHPSRNCQRRPGAPVILQRVSRNSRSTVPIPWRNLPCTRVAATGALDCRAGLLVGKAREES